MIERDLQELLAETMRDVLETSFFAEILEGRDDEVSFDSCSVVAVKMKFSGAASGSFVLLTDMLTAHTLAVEFMGGSGEATDDEIAGGNGEMSSLSVADEEIFKELANILCGSVLSRFQTERCCSLSQPVLCSGEIAEEWEESSVTHHIHSTIRLESGVVAGHWMLDVGR